MFRNVLLKIKDLLKKEKILIFLILLLALSLRLVNLQAEPYWGDELLSLDIVEQYRGDLSGMIHYLREVEVHPPLYYIFLKYWTTAFGQETGAVRSLSLFFGLGLIYLSHLFFKKIFNNKNVGLLAAFFTAILPIQIEYSQEARPYIIFTFFGLLSAYFLWQYFYTKKKYICA